MKIKPTHKFTVQLISASLTLIVGLGLILCGLFIPPQGVIDSSVLVAYGESLSFVGAVLGVDYHYRYKEHHENQRNNDNTEE